MFCRHKQLRVGQQVTLRNPESSYWLPKGLEPGTRATLIKSYYGALTIEQNGQQWQIPYLCIDHELEYEVRKNVWLSKDHPETIQEMERERVKVEMLRLATLPNDL